MTGTCSGNSTSGRETTRSRCKSVVCGEQEDFFTKAPSRRTGGDHQSGRNGRCFVSEQQIVFESSRLGMHAKVSWSEIRTRNGERTTSLSNVKEWWKDGRSWEPGSESQSRRMSHEALQGAANGHIGFADDVSSSLQGTPWFSNLIRLTSGRWWRPA